MAILTWQTLLTFLLRNSGHIILALPDFVFPPIIFMFSVPLVHVRCWRWGSAGWRGFRVKVWVGVAYFLARLVGKRGPYPGLR